MPFDQGSVALARLAFCESACSGFGGEPRGPVKIRGFSSAHERGHGSIID